MKILKLTVATLFTTFLLTSCAHTPPTKGDQMMQASTDAKALSKQWEKGHKLSSAGTTQHSKGLTMVSEGEDKVTKGNDLISNGQQKYDKGQQLQQESENSFNKQFTNSAHS